MKKFWIITLAFITGVLVAGCVTQKKKGDEAGRFKRGYHSLTTKYNYWFNADELFRLTTDRLEEQHKDNYNQVLDIYPYLAADPQPAKGDLDNVIKKAAYGIALHRPGDWVDDCYTLIGQAQYVKHDFETAESTFRYIKDEHDPHKKNKRKLVTKKDKKEAAKVKKKAVEKKKKTREKAVKEKEKKDRSKEESDCQEEESCCQGQEKRQGEGQNDVESKNNGSGPG